MRNSGPIKSRRVLSSGTKNLSAHFAGGNQKINPHFISKISKKTSYSQLNLTTYDEYPGFTKAKISYKANGIVKAYGANTY